MKHNEFVIGENFYTKSCKWRCTDVGTRTIAAICVDEHPDQTWYNGPPYAVEELIFDEYGMRGCTKEPYIQEELQTPSVYDPDLIA